MSVNLPAVQQAEVAKAHKFRSSVPAAHRASLDTRIQWMWNQRLGTIQTIWKASQEARGDILDFTAATLILQAAMGKDLDSIQQVFERLEGGALPDDKVLEREQSMRLR